jgi:tRNA(Ile)-lysidine synthase TilS/MesJ
MTLVDVAICNFEMIEDGDRVLVALSGDQKSMALIHILK